MSAFKMSRLQTDRRVRIGLRRMFAELRETFQRRRALLAAQRLADRIGASLAGALRATRAGYENAEDQTQSVQGGAGRLQKAAAALREDIAQTRDVRVEWTEGLDRLDRLVSGVREKIGEMETRIGSLETIQAMLDDLGFQTNMSSLNAIVNAARTENRGEIFAAVAEEARSAAGEIRGHIDEILATVRNVNAAIQKAGERFHRFDEATTEFRATSEAIIGLSNEIVGFSREQEQSLGDIAQTIQEVGSYAYRSRARYRNMNRKETEVREYLANLEQILSTRMGFWGPYRLNKTISLDNQRINVEAIREVAEKNEAAIRTERAELDRRSGDIAEAAEKLDGISNRYGRFTEIVSRARRMMEEEATAGLARISESARALSEQIGRISGFLDAVGRIKTRMENTVLFNDLLPLVARMAALLAEGDHDLQVRVMELTRLLHRLRDAAREIDDFLRKAGGEAGEMAGMCREMESELDRSRKSADAITGLLAGADETAARRREQIEAIGGAIRTIRKALDANRTCADDIDVENDRLGAATGDYIAILDRRRDRRNSAPSVAREKIPAIPAGPPAAPESKPAASGKAGRRLREIYKEPPDRV
jgi:methyl-accepting chemotaxis protein